MGRGPSSFPRLPALQGTGVCSQHQLCKGTALQGARQTKAWSSKSHQTSADCKSDLQLLGGDLRGEIGAHFIFHYISCFESNQSYTAKINEETFSYENTKYSWKAQVSDYSTGFLHFTSSILCCGIALGRTLDGLRPSHCLQTDLLSAEAHSALSNPSSTLFNIQLHKI